MTETRISLGVSPAPEFGRAAPLFAAIRGLWPVDFELLAEGPIPPHVRGVIVLGGDVRTAAVAATQLPVLFLAPGPGAATVRRSTQVEMRSVSSLDPCLNRSMDDSDVVSFVPLTPQADDEIVGQMEGQPFWLKRGTEHGSVDMVALSLPAFGDGGRLIEHFRPGRFVRLLPLLHFIRHAVAETEWDPGPPRACFVFDDPDLRRPRFGCLDFRELARHAQDVGYHASIATVPLDLRYAGVEAVSIFREHAAQLSLLVHGNNHTHLELLHCDSDGDRQALLAEALRRIHAFELRHGVAVDRVMEAPHGVIARDMFPCMAAMGFESTMTTFAHMLHYQPTEPWPSHFGMDMAEFMPGGFATIPRILMLPDWRTAVALAGFLRQPIVVAGHHADAVDGLGFLAELAEMVAGFGPVRWLSPAGIARSNFKTRREGSCLRVKAYQRRISVTIQEGIDRIVVERAWMAADETEHLMVQSPAGTPALSAACGRVSAAIQVRSGDRIDVRSLLGQAVDPDGVLAPPWRLWPIARRFMTETRDRYYPWFHRRSKHKAMAAVQRPPTDDATR